MLSHFFFFFNDTATTEIYTLSLHDALPICGDAECRGADHEGIEREGDQLQDHREPCGASRLDLYRIHQQAISQPLHRDRSEEHTSELQSLAYLVCRLLLEKKKNQKVFPVHA